MSLEKPCVIEADDDIFDINDFTVVTMLEGFIVSLENILQNCNAWFNDTINDDNAEIENGSEYLMKKVDDRHVYFDGLEFQLIFYRDKRIDYQCSTNDDADSIKHLCLTSHELLDSRFDFRESSSLSKQFGVFKYIVISHTSSKSIITDENQLNSILSAINVASLNIECEIPIFVQIDDASRELYMGVAQNRNVHIDFDGAQVSVSLHRHKFLNSLVDMFKQKVSIPIPVSNKVYASVQLDFLYRKGSPAPSVVAALDTLEAKNINVTNELIAQSIEYPFGADLDPLKALKLSVNWLDVDVNILNESDTYSDLDLFSAPKWIISAVFHSDSKYLLSTMLAEFLDIQESSCSNCVVQSFADTASHISTSAADALNPIAQNFSTTHFNFFSSRTLTDCTTVNSHKSSQQAAQHLKACLNELQGKEANDSEEFVSANVEFADFYNFVDRDYLRNIKGAPYEGFISKITKYLVNQFLCPTEHEFEMFACLWLKFVEYLRECWVKITDLPGFDWEQGQPFQVDMSKCLLQQKCQMLQFCIMTKRERHLMLDKKFGKKTCEIKDDEDNFYDANDTFDESTTSDNSALAEQSRGRLHIMDSAEFLINHSDRPIYVPITQDFGPMTEDIVDQYTNYLSSLDGGSDARTRAQLDILLADMQAFKAANPGCVLEDFVRWHSPRDFVPGQDGEKGVLSERMSVEGSVWLETWKDAQPIPVSQQSRLFNETKEAEAILQTFERIKMNDLVNYLIPVILADATRILIKKCCDCLPIVKERLLQLCKKVMKLSQKLTTDDIYDIRVEVETIEIIVSRYFSLKSLISLQTLDIEGAAYEETLLQSLLMELLSIDESARLDPNKCYETKRAKIVDAPQGNLAAVIYKCFVQFDGFTPTENRQPTPTKKQYILRWTAPRPGVNSRLLPHRMFACIDNDDIDGSDEPKFRLGGSFCSDITFS